MAKKTPPETPALTQRPFAELSRALGGGAPAGSGPVAATAAAPGAAAASAPAPPPARPRVERAVVRYEKKGRGGKEVTVIEKLGLRDAELAVWLKALKQALGTGGAVEDGNLVLQGDQRARVGALLTARGVGKITVA